MILIVCAMENEAFEIKKAMKNIEIDKLTQNRFYYKGKLQDKEVVLIITGVGKVNAAFMTALALSKFYISYIINIGLAGALNPYKVGDKVVIKDATYYDVDVSSVFNLYEFGQIPGMPNPYLSDFDLLRKATFSLDAPEESLFTGDRFLIKKPAKTNGIYDMEGAAIYQVAHIFNTKIISLKLISDIINTPTQNQDYSESEKTSQLILKDMVMKII